MLRRQIIWKIVPTSVVTVLSITTVVTILVAIGSRTESSGVRWSLVLCVLSGGLLCALALAIIQTWILNRHMREPVNAFQRAIKNYTGEDIALPARGALDGEWAMLYDALDEMAERVHERLQAITGHATERQAVLSSMAEGVLAIDAEGRVITLNAAAVRLIGSGGEHMRGRSIYETVRNTDLQHCVERVLRGDSPIETEVILRVDGGERFLQVHGSALQGDRGNRTPGAVIVLNDVTRLRQLEQVRQQFVANVSHELKTPITAIKAAVETLEDSGLSMDDTAVRFLPVIARQADRLHAIVEDLLTLARIEQDENAGQITLKRGKLINVMRGAVETCQAKARQREIELLMDSPDDLAAPINAPLLEQAIVNLLDNAIKFSPTASTVRVSVERQNGEAIIAVEDHGLGIEAEHLPRLFERFYRTDKARSRAVGGTGLGLSIVKHVAQSHGGHVSVDSTLGVGSTFRVHLPV